MINPWKRLETKAQKRVNRFFEDDDLLTVKECCLHPFVFLYISKRFLKEHTKDWYQPYKGTPIILSLVVYSLVFTMMFATVAVIIFAAISGTSYETTSLLIGGFMGVVSGYIFTIEQEWELLHVELDRAQAIKKIRRWGRNGALKGLTESLGTRHFQHEYFHEN